MWKDIVVVWYYLFVSWIKDNCLEKSVTHYDLIVFCLSFHIMKPEDKIKERNEEKTSETEKAPIAKLISFANT